MRAVFLCALAAAALAPPQAIEAADYSVKVRRGQKADVEKVRVEFIELQEDSRCPVGAECIAAGNARVLLRLEAASRPPASVLLNTDREPRRSDYAGLVFELTDVLPHPKAGKTISRNEAVAVLAVTAAEPRGPAESRAAPTAPVVVELFTSEGCSSCPPADELVSTWGKEQFEAGRIIPLVFHVDYWNSGGWKDPFSSVRFTERQHRYAGVLRVDSVYTPQMIVGGRREFVGSERYKAQAAVEESAAGTAALSLEQVPSAGSLRLRVKIRPTARMGETHGAQSILVAVFQNGLSTSVSGGENRGRTLTGDFIVRDFRDLGVFYATAGFDDTVEIPWEKDWDAGRMGAAAFLQDVQSLRTSDAAKVYPLVR